MLNIMSVLDVSSPSALFVCSNVAKDVAADATINKAADHAIVTTNIATVVEEIVYKDEIKTLESDVIVDMAENVVDEAVGRSGVENDDGHAAREQIVATANENVVKHVSHTITHKLKPTSMEVFDAKIQLRLWSYRTWFSTSNFIVVSSYARFF